MEFDAVILAGGRGRRLGEVSKADLQIGNRRLIDIAIAAVADARQVVVAGDVPLDAGVTTVIEDPPGGGPVAGLFAGLAAIATPSEFTAVLACDIPAAEAAMATVRAAVDPSAEVDGWCALPAGGQAQWLLGMYRTDALRHAFAGHGTGHGLAMRRLLAPLRLELVACAADATDIDTPDDLRAWEQAGIR